MKQLGQSRRFEIQAWGNAGVKTVRYISLNYIFFGAREGQLGLAVSLTKDTNFGLHTQINNENSGKVLIDQSVVATGPDL